MRRLPPLNSIKGFEAVVRLGNYNKAAAELGVTHGAISRQVRVLEHFFGCRLFRPSGRQLVPTELGRFFATEAGAGPDRIARATERVVEPAAARLVRVSGTPSLTMHWLMPRLGEFHHRHPTTEVSIAATRESLENLVSTSDVILGRRPMQWDGFECRALFSDRRVLVCTPEYAHAHGVRRPEDVVGLTLLMSDGKNHAGAWDTWMQTHGLRSPRVQKRIKFDHLFVMIGAVIQGLGVALLSEALMRVHLDAGTLVRPLENDSMPYPDMYALFPGGPSRSTSVRSFTNWLVGEGETISIGNGRAAGEALHPAVHAAE